VLPQEYIWETIMGGSDKCEIVGHYIREQYMVLAIQQVKLAVANRSAPVEVIRLNQN
jgi:hypothetical protein